jgi:hypothetical protein
VRIAHGLFRATSKKTRAEREQRAKNKKTATLAKIAAKKKSKEEKTATLAKIAAKKEKHENCRARSDDQNKQNRHRGRVWHRQTPAAARISRRGSSSGCCFYPVRDSKSIKEKNSIWKVDDRW